MRYLGIDYGAKRIGIAFSDDGGRIAFPEMVIQNNGTDRIFKEIKSLVNKEHISKIIVGLPLGADGKATAQTKIVEDFAEKLKEKVSIPVEFENELLTTRMAQNAGIANEHTDASAAALILQSYLDRDK